MDSISLPLFGVACALLSGDSSGAITESAKGVLESYFVRRTSDARRILLNEVGEGKISDLEARDRDATIHLLYTFLEASIRGRARENLVLLARLIAGLKTDDDLFSDQFDRFQRELAQLDKEEIIILSYAAQKLKKQKEKLKNVNVSYVHLSGFGDEAEFKGIHVYEVLSRLVRTGFIATDYANSSIDSVAPLFLTTTRFKELIELIHFDGLGI
ncbi:hypothetical protein [Hyphococcus sp.]|jgi:hypothetical protein|uniref:hypothetical protein n=1 Tax=Hyphococcus sp. TaxID=2038636 RepID=UPI003D09ABA8